MQYSGCNCLTMCLKRMCWSTRQPVRGVLISFRRQLFSLPCSQQLTHGYRIIGDVKDEILSRVVSYLRYEGGQSSFKWAAVSIALRYSPISTVWKRDQCFAICRKSKVCGDVYYIELVDGYPWSMDLNIWLQESRCLPNHGSFVPQVI